ncbi:MAG: NAD-dependent epimerase/dehydratase family protein, partial [Candidatus Zapsychrus exili]|nr:NAD-dependent epimerase/dehydratase family protein [Candidatus Zapsychrus exili]
MRKKVLITGVSGFLGNGLRDLILKEDKFEVFGVDLKLETSSKHMLVCDLHDRRRIKALFIKLKPHYIFHLAGSISGDSAKLFNSNVLSTQAVLDVISSIGSYKPRVVIPGSAAEYGFVDKVNGCIRETIKPSPSSWYGMTKYMQTLLSASYIEKGVDVTIGRIFNVSGKGTPTTLSLGYFAKEISILEKQTRKKILRTKNLSGQRDFLDIEDVCRALLLIAYKGKPGHIYNICSGNSYNMRDLLKKLLKLSSRDDIILKEDRTYFSKSFDCVGCNNKIKKETGWRPEV